MRPSIITSIVMGAVSFAINGLVVVVALASAATTSNGFSVLASGAVTPVLVFAGGVFACFGFLSVIAAYWMIYDDWQSRQEHPDDSVRHSLALRRARFVAVRLNVFFAAYYLVKLAVWIFTELKAVANR